MTNFNIADQIIRTESEIDGMFSANILEKCNNSELVESIEQDLDNETTVFIFTDGSVIEVTSTSARSDVSFDALSNVYASDYSEEEMDYKLATFF